MTVSVFIGAIAGVATVTAPMTRAIARDAVVAHGESVFVRRDTFALYLERQRSARQLDSVERAAMRADLDTIKRMVRDSK